jgi:DNA-binding FrmR family transcriptional regulator
MLIGLTPPQVGWHILAQTPAGGKSMKAVHKQNALNRLKTIRGHLDAVIAMVEEERYCPQIMKQVSAVQGSLERVNRILLQNHLETCVPRAVSEGRAEDVVDELLEALRYTGAVTGPSPAQAGAGVKG